MQHNTTNIIRHHPAHHHIDSDTIDATPATMNPTHSILNAISQIMDHELQP